MDLTSIRLATGFHETTSSYVFVVTTAARMQADFLLKSLRLSAENLEAQKSREYDDSIAVLSGVRDPPSSSRKPADWMANASERGAAELLQAARAGVQVSEGKEAPA